MFNKFDVLETIDMIEKEHLDIRTVTMGISLLPCIRESAEKTASAVYDRVCGKAKDLVKTAEALSAEYGIPIVNKRVSVTPVSLVTAAFPEQSALVGMALDKAASELGIDFLGGYSALVHKGNQASRSEHDIPRCQSLSSSQANHVSDQPSSKGHVLSDDPSDCSLSAQSTPGSLLSELQSVLPVIRYRQAFCRTLR